MQTWLMVGLGVVLALGVFVAWLAQPVSWRDGERQEKEPQWGPMGTLTDLFNALSFLADQLANGFARLTQGKQRKP